MSKTDALAIPADHPAYAGHFPGAPVLPGVVLLDAAVRAVQLASPSLSAPWHVLTAKFHSVVHPGDALALEYEPLANGSVRFNIRSANRSVASGVLKSSVPPDKTAAGCADD